MRYRDSLYRQLWIALNRGDMLAARRIGARIRQTYTEV